MRPLSHFLFTLAGGLLAALPTYGDGLRLGSQISYSHPTFALETATSAGRVEFVPRIKARPGIDASYGGFGFSLSLPDVDGGFPDGRGSGGLNDFRTHWHGDSWGVETHHRHAQGFEVTPASPFGTAPLPRPDVTLRLTDVTLYRSFDPDSKVYHLSEGLPATGGEVDFFLMTSLSHARMRAERPFLHNIASDDAGSRFDAARAMDVASLGVGGGYAMSGNLNGLYIEQALFAGYGPQYRRLGEEADWAWNMVKVNVRLRLGLRTRWFDMGAGFENDAQAVMLGREQLIALALVARAGLEVFL